MRSVLFALALTSVAIVNAERKHYELTLTNQVISPDGENRSAIVVNGVMPGPLLTAFKGDEMTVLVKNRLVDPSMRRDTSVHWHGILQPLTAYDDGPAFITQCPIPPGSDYTYQLALSREAGTFWYHSHLSSQYIDGLRGPLVIYDHDDPHRYLYDFDNETTIFSLTDWYQNSSEILLEGWINNKTSFPVPDSNLFNGVGRYLGGPLTPRAVVWVQRHKRYRFRIINMSAHVPFNFGIERHDLTVIEADGENHKPYLVSSVLIAPGQRYSVILHANQPSDNYWIAYPSNFADAAEPEPCPSTTVTTVPTVNPRYNGTEAFAILRYEDALPFEPRRDTFVPDDSRALEEHKLEPLENRTFPEKADKVIPLFVVEQNDGPIEQPGVSNNWTINGSQFKPPSLTTLLRILAGATNESDFPTSDNTYVLEFNKTIEVQLISSANHPFHLHGHTFQVIQSARGERNVKNPPIRDTVQTNNQTDPEKAVTIRFRTDNPGPWFLHCHKDWHLEAGMGAVFAEDPKGQREGPFALHPPPEWTRLCAAYKNFTSSEPM